VKDRIKNQVFIFAIRKISIFALLYEKDQRWSLILNYAPQYLSAKCTSRRNFIYYCESFFTLVLLDPRMCCLVQYCNSPCLAVKCKLSYSSHETIGEVNNWLVINHSKSTVKFISANGNPITPISYVGQPTRPLD